MKGKKCLSGIKELQCRKHNSGRNPNSVPTTGWKQGFCLFCFYEKKEKNTWKEEKSSYWCWQAEPLLAIHDWLLILPSERRSIIISPCDQDVCFPADFTHNCLWNNCGLSQSQGLAQSKVSQNKVSNAVPLEWPLWLQFKMVLFMSFFFFFLNSFKIENF